LKALSVLIQFSLFRDTAVGGEALLKDAMLRTLQAAEIAGIRAFAVHAKDEDAQQFYQHFDFVPSRTDPMHLFILLKDIRRIVLAH
jgi:hypothetical protein